jgi:hypothetical protein
MLSRPAIPLRGLDVFHLYLCHRVLTTAKYLPSIARAVPISIVLSNDRASSCSLDLFYLC